MADAQNTSEDPRLAQLSLRVAENIGLESETILQAFRSVPRQTFVPEASAQQAFEDVALSIAEGQRISQPSMIAIMLRDLEVAPGMRVLEVGAGSGYAAALLAKLSGEVHAIECHPRLVQLARENLARAGTTGVTVHQGDGRLGLAEFAPFARILVSAFATSAPEALLAQLAPGGRLVVPIGEAEVQLLTTFARDKRGELHVSTSTPCIFVPLVAPPAS